MTALQRRLHRPKTALLERLESAQDGVWRVEGLVSQSLSPCSSRGHLTFALLETLELLPAVACCAAPFAAAKPNPTGRPYVGYPRIIVKLRPNTTRPQRPECCRNMRNRLSSTRATTRVPSPDTSCAKTEARETTRRESCW